MTKKKLKLRGIIKALFLVLAAMIISLQGFAQSVVTGTITGLDGEPIPGATVVVEGTTNGTVTNNAGEFTINVNEGDVLMFSFVGMQSQKIPYTGQNEINIQLQADVIGLEEVVAVGYGTMKKSDLTGSAIKADIESFREAPNTSIMQSLQGSVTRCSNWSGKPCRTGSFDKYSG